jgi:hypothetical protein
MSNGGSISGQALDNDALYRVCPSIFATEAHESRSDRFAPVPTINVVEGLRREGFEVFSAQQAKTRQAGRREFTKHMLRLRHQSLARAAGEAFEVILVNANDGSSSYQMIPGFFRFVCANGLMTGDTFNEVKVKHSGDAVSQVIEGAYTVLEDAPRVCGQVDQMKALALRPEERELFARCAHVIRFPNAEERPEAAPIPPARLLLPRRPDDRGSDLWSTFNVVQENTIRGGQAGRTVNANNRVRRVTTREINGIDQSKAINRALWMLAEEMGRLKGQPLAA